ncbi:MAG: hypothetical protein JSV73_09770 [Flavobacteriaceae bacterium]|nr:MAG: hypothetical protein JSV73_09770 [Flavobacteriaceae bacterium]
MKNDKENTAEQTLFQEAIHHAKTPVIIALFLTPVRFTLELLGVPENFIFIVGLLWFTIGISIYWGIRFYQNERFLKLLLLSLVIYSPISRIPVAMAWWIDTNWQLGTHYGLYFDTFGQILLNQVFYGSLLQIIPGFITGSIAFVIMQNRRPKNYLDNTINNE